MSAAVIFQHIQIKKFTWPANNSHWKQRKREKKEQFNEQTLMNKGNISSSSMYFVASKVMFFSFDQYLPVWLLTILFLFNFNFCFPMFFHVTNEWKWKFNVWNICVCWCHTHTHTQKLLLIKWVKVESLKMATQRSKVNMFVCVCVC